MVLGVQGLHYLGEFSQNYQTMELKLKSIRKDIVIHDISSGAPRIASAKRMERSFP